MKTAETLPESVELLRRLLWWRMAFFSVLILLAGIALGASGAVIWMRHHRPDPVTPRPIGLNRLMQRLTDRLDLTEDQARRVRQILQRTAASLEDIRREARPRIRQQLRRMNRGIRDVLQPNQQARWDRMARSLIQLLEKDRLRTATLPAVKPAPAPVNVPAGSGEGHDVP